MCTHTHTHIYTYIYHLYVYIYARKRPRRAPPVAELEHVTVPHAAARSSDRRADIPAPPHAPRALQPALAPPRALAPRVNPRCIYICIHTHTHTHTHIYISIAIYLSTSIYIYMYLRTQAAEASATGSKAVAYGSTACGRPLFRQARRHPSATTRAARASALPGSSSGSSAVAVAAPSTRHCVTTCAIKLSTLASSRARASGCAAGGGEAACMARASTAPTPSRTCMGAMHA